MNSTNGPTLTQRPLGGCLMPGCGDREQCLGEHRPGQGVHGEPAVHPAVAVVGHREPHRRRSLTLLTFEELGFSFVGLLGCDHLEQAAPEDAESFGVVLGGFLDQEPFGLLDQVLVEVGGELLERCHDHVRLLHQHVAGRERDPDRLVPRCQGGREAQLLERLTPGLVRDVRPPHRGRCRTRGLADVCFVRVRGDPQLQLGDPGLEVGCGGQRRGRLVRVHGPHRCLSDLVDDLVQPRDSTRHRVSW
jgi:hypothetical protein